MAFLSTLYREELEGTEDMEHALERLRAEAPLLADFVAEPNLGVTMTPTRRPRARRRT